MAGYVMLENNEKFRCNECIQEFLILRTGCPSYIQVLPRKVLPRKVLPRKVLALKVLPCKVLSRKVLPRKVLLHKVLPVPRKVLPK